MATDVLPERYFEGRRFAIVGCARGLGRAFATRLAGLKAELLLYDIDPAADEVAKRVQGAGGRAAFEQIDIRDVKGFEAKFMSSVGHSGLDGLIYLIRGRERAPIGELASEQWDNDFALTIKGAFFSARAAAPLLGRRSAASSAILFVSSILSELAGLEGVSYHAAKAALDQLTRYLAVQLGPQGIRVNSVQPGFIVQDEHVERYLAAENSDYRKLTEFVHPLRRSGFSDDVIEPMLFLLSPMSKFITGQILRIDGGSSVQEQWSLMRTAQLGGAFDRKQTSDD